MSLNPRIDWESLLHGKYAGHTVEFMLRDMYGEFGGVTKIATILGVSRGSVLRKLRSLSISVNRRGGDNRRQKVLAPKN